MTGISLIALSPLQGAEGELKQFIRSNPGWMSPLPLIIPLHSFKESFPRDRIDPVKLKALPPVTLTGPFECEGNMVLTLDTLPISTPGSYTRTIHGKELPPPVTDSPFTWNGLLLSPSGMPPNPGHPGSGGTADKLCRFHYERWQIGLYRILYNEKRMWWEDIKVRCLWKIRKGRS